MEWRDEGVILGLSPYGERSFLVQILTSSKGRHLGLWRRSGKNASLFQMGMQVSVTWKARLESQLGLWTLESIHNPHFFTILRAPLPLLGFLSLCALCRKSLPERQPFPVLYEAFLRALGHLAGPSWMTALVDFELILLKELGYGLSLERCAVTGVQENLTHVSPVSGKAVCAVVAEAYKDRLFPLPPFLGKKSGAKGAVESLLHLQQAFGLTEAFFNKHVFDKKIRAIPEARSYFLSKLYQSFQQKAQEKAQQKASLKTLKKMAN